MEKNFQLLAFDTALFGFGVAKIVSSKLSPDQLQEIITGLRAQNIRLVYWPSDSTDRVSQTAAQQFSGFLGSEQITYLLNLNTIEITSETETIIESYQDKTPTDALKQMALYAGTYSHFKTDPQFPQQLFVKLYDAWITNSVNGSIAQAMLVTKNQGEITGMITLDTKNDRGDIGLLGIDPNFRGQKLGTKLVLAAQSYFKKEGFAQLQVVTQKANIAACRLYEKCGFKIEKTENFYHFWL